jgi:hypothetical protein
MESTSQRRIRRAAELTGNATLHAAVVWFVVLAPVVAVLKLTEWAFNVGSPALEYVVSAVLMALTVAMLWWTFTGSRMVGRLRLGRFQAIVLTSTTVLFAFASFSSLTAVLYREGAVSFGGPRLADARLIDRTTEFYAWHLADSVPLLGIPQNLAWAEPLRTHDRLVGLLLIVFIGIVALPLVATIRLIVEGHGDGYPTRVVRALRRGGAFDVRVPEVGDVTAFVAVDGDQFLVDAVEATWNADPALRRLAAVSELGPAGYLLVTAAVGERARDELERALAAAPMPAALVVWRGDEPALGLQQAVTRLLSAAGRAAAPDPAEAPTGAPAALP